MQSAKRLLRELIAIPSVNPAFLSPGDPRAGEKLVADFLAAAAAQARLDSEFQKVAPARSNLLVRLVPSKRTQSRVILAPHLDTVGEPAMLETMFDPVDRNSRIHGRGACDTKGSVAAMFAALLELARGNVRPETTEILFVGLADEEHHQLGSRGFIADGWKGDLAIVGEPTRLKAVTAHKGDLWLRLQTKGKSAHGSRPELGKNAVHMMARIVDVLENDYAAFLRTKKHPLLGSPTINVGLIRGGTQPNIVPPSCFIEVDRRTVPGENERLVRREIQSFLKEKGAPTELVSTKSYSALPLETDPRLPLVQQFLRSMRQQQPCGVDFFCDAAIIAQSGTPCVVFGPGDIAQAHTADEWISIRSLEQGAELLLRFLRTLP